jgi:hypothetical protein
MVIIHAPNDIAIAIGASQIKTPKHYATELPHLNLMKTGNEWPRN